MKMLQKIASVFVLALLSSFEPAAARLMLSRLQQQPAAKESIGVAQQLRNIEMQVAKMNDLKENIIGNLARLRAGGHQASLASRRLLSVAAEPSALQLMKTLGVEAAAARLMKSPASDERLQRLAGSIVTLLSGMPVTAQLSDESSGSYGQVHIVVPRPSRVYRPDQVMLDLEAGAHGSEID